jgi:hypothetical protein
MRQQLNYTCMYLHAEKLTEIVLHLNLGHFVVFFFCFVLFWFFGYFSPLMRQWQNYFWDTISKIGGWGTNTKIINTETLLNLNLEIFFSFIYFFIFIFFQSSICLSNACSAYCWLVHYLFLVISLKIFCLFHCFVFFYFFVYLFFPFSLTSLFSISSHPSILNITIVFIAS